MCKEGLEHTWFVKRALNSAIDCGEFENMDGPFCNTRKYINNKTQITSAAGLSMWGTSSTTSLEARLLEANWSHSAFQYMALLTLPAGFHFYTPSVGNLRPLLNSGSLTICAAFEHLFLLN